MPKGKYTAADVAPDSGSMPNAGPMGKYSTADVADAPPVGDDDPISRFFQGAGDRIKGMAEGMTPQGADEIIGGPGYKVIKGAVQGAKGAYDSAQKSAEEGDVPGSMLKSVAAAIPLVGPGAASVYDRAKSGDTAGAVGMGGVDALAMLLPTKGGKVADAAADAAAHPMVRGAGRVVRDFDITKPFKSIGENVAGPVMDKLGQMRAARGRPQLQSPLDPSAGVRVAPGAPVTQPRVPSPAEDLISAMDNESAVRRAPDTSPAPPQVRVKHAQEGIQSPLEQGQGAVTPRQFGDAPVSADASHIPTLAEEMQSPLEPGVGPRPMQPTADMTSGRGGANYSAGDLANLISKHNIPPAPGEIVGAPEDTPMWSELHESSGSAAQSDLADPLIRKFVEPSEYPSGNFKMDYLHDDLRDVRDDAAILQAMREDLDAHGRNALHEESTDFAARNKVNNPKVGKPGYGWKRKLPEAGQ